MGAEHFALFFKLFVTVAALFRNSVEKLSDYHFGSQYPEYVGNILFCYCFSNFMAVVEFITYCRKAITALSPF